MVKKESEEELYGDMLFKKAFSFKGFKITRNFMSSLKNSFYTLVPGLISILVFNDLVSAGMAIFISNMCFKAIEYWFKNY